MLRRAGDHIGDGARCEAKEKGFYVSLQFQYKPDLESQRTLRPLIKGFGERAGLKIQNICFHRRHIDFTVLKQR
jgi:hypothetical protein